MYLKKAGTVILVIAVIVWVLSNFPVVPNATPSAQLSGSIAGTLGHAIAPLLKPLGLDWKMSIALLCGLAAKEVIVSTLGTIYTLGNTSAGGVALQTALRHDPGFSPLIALSLLVFIMLYVPCMSATTVFHKEAGAWRWTLFYLALTTGAAYLMAFFVYQGGLRFF
jgi:ferrous iron transport protein B